MNLLSQSQIYPFSGAFKDHFDTFLHRIVVFKEPIRNINTSSALNGYGLESNQTVTYTPVSGIFSGMYYNYNQQQKYATLFEAKTYLDDGITRIKIEKPARDYINRGKTEKLLIAGSSYNIDGPEQLQHYFGLTFYRFNLKRTE